MWTINGLFCFGSTLYFSSTHSRCSIAACLFLRRKLSALWKKSSATTPNLSLKRIIHSVTLILFQNDKTFFLLQNTKRAVLKTTFRSLFHVIAINGNWSFQESKRMQMHHKSTIKVDYTTQYNCLLKQYSRITWRTNQNYNHNSLNPIFFPSSSCIHEWSTDHFMNELFF